MTVMLARLSHSVTNGDTSSGLFSAPHICDGPNLLVSE